MVYYNFNSIILRCFYLYQSHDTQFNENPFNKEIIKMIISRNLIDVNCTMNNGNTLLFMACNNKIFFVFAIMLLDKECSFTEYSDEEGQTALHNVINNIRDYIRNKLKGEIIILIEKLILSNVTNIDAIDKYNNTPLSLAIQYNLFYIVNLLMKYNANIYKKLRGQDNKSPLRLAVYKVTHTFNFPFMFGRLNFIYNPKDPESDTNKKPPIEYYDCFNAIICKNNAAIFKWLLNYKKEKSLQIHMK